MKITTDRPGDPPVLWNWLSSHTGLPWSTDLRTIGLVREDFTIAAVVGYNCWVGDSCFIHMAFDSPRSMTRDLIREAFSFPFQTVSVIYGLTPITKEDVLAFNKRMGFREVHRTSHFVLQEMRIENCRWLKETVNGRKIKSTGSAELHGSSRSDSRSEQRANG